MVLGGRRPGSAGAGVSARGLGSRGEEVGAGVAVYPRVREEGVGGGVIALCSDCRVLSAASAGKEVGRLAALGLPGGKAAEGGVMKCERYGRGEGTAPPLVGGGMN